MLQLPWLQLVVGKMPPSDSKTPAVELSDDDIEEWPPVTAIWSRGKGNQWVCKKPFIYGIYMGR